jgi:hypothetical protein
VNLSRAKLVQPSADTRTKSSSGTSFDLIVTWAGEEEGETVFTFSSDGSDESNTFAQVSLVECSSSAFKMIYIYFVLSYD